MSGRISGVQDLLVCANDLTGLPDLIDDLTQVHKGTNVKLNVRALCLNEFEGEVIKEFLPADLTVGDRKRMLAEMTDIGRYRGSFQGDVSEKPEVLFQDVDYHFKGYRDKLRAKPHFDVLFANVISLSSMGVHMQNDEVEEFERADRARVQLIHAAIRSDKVAVFWDYSFYRDARADLEKYNGFSPDFRVQLNRYALRQLNRVMPKPALAVAE